MQIEGGTVIYNLDIYAQVGGWYALGDQTFVATVTDGQLNVDFLKDASGSAWPILSAIAVMGLQPMPTATP